MIRPANTFDRDQAVLLLKASRIGAGFDTPAGPTGFVFPFEAAYAARLFEHHLCAPKAYALVHEVDGIAQGLLLATAFEHPFGPVWLAKETVWWIQPAHRGRAAILMLDAYEAWAAEQGCQFIGMAGMGEDPDVAKLYRRRGYKVAETHFLKPV